MVKTVKRIREKLLNLPKKKLTLVSFLFTLITASILFYFFFPKKVNQDEDISYSPEDIVIHSVEKPSEEVVSTYEVAPDMPRSINLASIKNSGYIQIVGIDQDGNIAVPSNVLMAGWYKNSVKPGEEGLSIITGHRDGVMKKGIFRYLDKLKKGDSIQIEYGDRTIRYFEVEEIHVVSIEGAFDIMYYKKEDISRQLNLISCIGTYNKDTQTYDKRIIVVARGK